MTKIKILDCFAWVGGFHLALEQSIWKENIECIWLWNRKEYNS
jgi:site-specific DNA-cytosine methylase